MDRAEAGPSGRSARTALVRKGRPERLDPEMFSQGRLISIGPLPRFRCAAPVVVSRVGSAPWVVDGIVEALADRTEQIHQ